MMPLIIHTNFLFYFHALCHWRFFSLSHSVFGSTNNLFHYDRSLSRAICINILNFIKCYMPSSFRLSFKKCVFILVHLLIIFFSPHIYIIFFRCCSLFNEINLYLITCETCEYVAVWLHGGCCEIH